MTPTPSTEASPTLAHGMGADLTAPDWPPLTLAEVQALAPRYRALQGPLRLIWHSPRPFSAAARVQTAQGEVFIKRHDSRVRDLAGLHEEHRYIAHLRERGLGVPQVLENIERGSATALGGRTYEVHASVPGIDAYRDIHSWIPVRDAGDARALGGALARLHLAARGYAAPARPPRPLLAGIDIVGSPDLDGAVRRYVGQRPALARYLDGCGGVVPLVELLQTVHPRLARLLPALEPLWVHNDWHASNLFWSDGGAQREVTAAIDFGLCNRGWAVADLATALERNTVAWLEAGPLGSGAAARAPIGRVPLALALLDGYCALRPLSAAETLALPLLLSLAHVEYALSEADYFHGVLGNDDNARLAYPAFLAGHIAWFAGEPGRAYVDALRAHLGSGATQG